MLKTLDRSAWKTRIAEPQRKAFSRWHGDEAARSAVYANRIRLRSDIGKEAMRRRAEVVERSFATLWNAAACGERGCVVARTFASAT